MASIGALLDQLVRARAVDDLEDEGIRGLEVRDIECLALLVIHSSFPLSVVHGFSRNEVMQINGDALLWVNFQAAHNSCAPNKHTVVHYRCSRTKIMPRCIPIRLKKVFRFLVSFP